LVIDLDGLLGPAVTVGWRVGGVGVDLVKWIVDASIWRSPLNTRGGAV
jgi:hypothetical protein